MASVLQLMIQMRADDKEADRVRQEERDRLEQEREIRRIEREAQAQRDTREMITTLRAAQPAVPQTVTIVNHDLPKMKDDDEIETFIAMFEAALRSSNVSEDRWVAKLHSHLSPKAKLRIQDTIQDPDATYDEIKEGLMGYCNMSFSAVAETLMTGQKGKLYTLESRQCRDKIIKLVDKVIKNATTTHEITQCIAMAFIRQNLVPALKTYVDLKSTFTNEEFYKAIDEWEAIQPVGVQCFRKQNSSVSTTFLVANQALTRRLYPAFTVAR